MAVRDPLRMRKMMLAGAVALALTGTGAALAWSATGTPTPTPLPPQSAPGRDSAPGQHMKAQRSRPLHGEGVVKRPDGTFQTVLEQRGTVESVSDTAITVKSEDGFSQTYAVDGDTKVATIPQADDGKRDKPADGTIADIATGDTVRIAGVKDGDKAMAKRIVKGGDDGPGLGMGRGQGHGQGHGKGLGHRMGKGAGQDSQES